MEAEPRSEEVSSRIRSLYHGMSKAEKKVADFLLVQGKSLQFLSISDLASEVGASESTIFRFSRKLGYNGYPAFKRAFFSEILTDSPQRGRLTYERLIAGDSISDARRKLFALMRTALDDTVNNMVPAEFDNATRILASARRVRVFANDQSGHIAQTAAHKFLLLGMDITVHAERVLHKFYADHLSSRDACVILSHSGEAQDLLAALQLAADHGAHTIAITSNADSIVARSADIHLLTALPAPTLGDEAGLIRITQIAVLDCLALAVAHHRSQLAKEKRDTR